MTTDAQAIRHLWTHKTQDHPFLSDQELVIDRGEGVWIWTEQGKKLLDGFAGLAVVNVGHGRREIAEADRGADGAARLLPDHAAVLQPAGRGPGREARDPRAGRPALHDVRGERVGGQRALDADRAAVLAGRRQVGQAQGHLARRAATTAPRWARSRSAGCPTWPRPTQPLEVPGFAKVAPPHPFRDLRHRHRGRADRAPRRASCARPSCAKGPDTVSAVIMEPVLSSGGFIMPPIGWLRAVRALCDELDVLMIADEVITGFGRTGRWFAVEHDQVVPDLMSVAKGITSGYIPLSASHRARRGSPTRSPTPPPRRTSTPTPTPRIRWRARPRSRICKIMEQDRLVENAEKMGDAAARRASQRGGQAPHRGRGARARPAGLRGLRAARRLRQAARRQARGRARPQGVGPRGHHLRARHRAPPRAAALHHPRGGRRARWPSSPTASTPSSATSRNTAGSASYIPTFRARNVGM